MSTRRKVTRGDPRKRYGQESELSRLGRAHDHLAGLGEDLDRLADILSPYANGVTEWPDLLAAMPEAQRAEAELLAGRVAAGGGPDFRKGLPRGGAFAHRMRAMRAAAVGMSDG